MSTVETTDGSAILLSFKNKTREGLRQDVINWAQTSDATVEDITRITAQYQNYMAQVKQMQHDIVQALDETHSNSRDITDLHKIKAPASLTNFSRLFKPISVDTPDPNPDALGQAKIYPDAYGTIKIWHKKQVCVLDTIGSEGHLWYLYFKGIGYPIISIPYNPNSDPVRSPVMQIPINLDPNGITISATAEENSKLLLTFNVLPEDIGAFQLIKVR